MNKITVKFFFCFFLFLKYKIEVFKISITNSLLIIQGKVATFNVNLFYKVKKLH